MTTTEGSETTGRPGAPVRPPADAPPPGYALTHRQVLVVMVGLMTGMFLSALDQTIVSTALPTIAGELGAIDQLPWVATAYILTSTSSMPVIGKLSDLYGRRALFQWSIVIFVGASMLAGASQSMSMLVASRALQGVGGGGLMVLTFTVIGDVVPPRERGRYQGIGAAVFAVSSVLGPLIGGFFVDQLSWRWVFYVNVPVGVAALLVTNRALRLPRAESARSIDWLGAVLQIGACVTIILGLVWGGDRYEWTSPVVVGLFAAGAALVVAFVWQERRTPEPILPLRLFRNPIFTTSSGVAFGIGFLMFAVALFAPIFLQVVKGVSATSSGLLLLPVMIGIMVGSIGSGRITVRIGRYKIFPVLGSVSATTGYALLSRVDASTSRTFVTVCMLLVGLGVGMVTPNVSIAVQNSVAFRDLGIATSSITFIRSIGSVFGSAVLGAVMTARLAANLERYVPAAARGDLDPSQLLGSPAAIRALPADVQAGVVEAFEHALQTVFLCAVPVGVASLVVALCIKELPLRDRQPESGLGELPGG